MPSGEVVPAYALVDWEVQREAPLDWLNESDVAEEDSPRRHEEHGGKERKNEQTPCPPCLRGATRFEEAYDLAVDTIETAADAYVEQGRAFPPPMQPADEFSGRVTLRIPRSLHRSLAASAEDEGVSLNAHLVNVLWTTVRSRISAVR
ncbi:MAG: hypothetical protein C1943_07655 [Halochromatium sp.]|nr:hypothetical protein [Halochromatium sp.]